MNFHAACTNMINRQLRTNDVLNATVLDLYHVIRREDFIADPYKAFAYTDTHIDLGHQQCMMTPLEEALLLQALNLQGHEVVLEVGTGSGFLTALLSRFCKKVISVDYFQHFTNQAQKHLAACNITNVECVTGDASLGWLPHAPYDVIVYTSGMPQVSETIKLQVIPGGSLFVVLGKAPIMQGQLHRLDHNEQWHGRLIFETHLPPLITTITKNNFIF